jgi:phage terminase small subunit
MPARTGNGRSGPMPAPTVLKLLRGEVKRDRLNLDEPKVAPGLPERPTDMLDGADLVWDRIMAALAPTGAISLADGQAVRQFAEAVVIHASLVSVYNSTGSKAVIRNRAGEIVTNPILSGIARAGSAVQISAREIGATPASRNAVRVGRSPPGNSGRVRDTANRAVFTGVRLRLSTPIRKWVNVRNRLMQPAPGLSAAVRPGRDGDRAA